MFKLLKINFMPSPEKIAGKFVEECERVLNKKLVYTFFGSVRFKKYVEKNPT